MITNDDLNTLNLSPTNKDYYQVWAELLDVAGKISERWDPTSTNESDPGIVLLKVLTAIADKLNYNIDKNILEAFMPTAAQDESMKRLCDMMGYSIGYYQSATTDVIIRYLGNVVDISDENTERLPDGNNEDNITGLLIPAFTAISNEDKSIYYLTTQDVTLTNEETLVTVPCIEGQRILCETGESSIITRANLNVNNRFYLPENQIAENGIFVYSTVDGVKTTAWNKVDNLNIMPNNTKVYSFGFDSKENRPYIQFPSDVDFLLEDGLEIYYIRTKGASGNVASRTLTMLEKPTFGMWSDYADNEKFAVTNTAAALNGKNPETIEQAYNGFKKTIGTFNTLVTCRDYMNKIYDLMDEKNNPLVSNIVVSDIRDDINRSHTLCSFGDYGIVYLERANTEYSNEVHRSDLLNQPIDNFDLVLYPFKTYQQLDTINDYKNSFTYTDLKVPDIKAALSDIKTISHNYCQPVGNEVVCIKNYLQLNARIATVNKVNSAEESLILNNIKSALYRAFNMRELDFGEEIPYDSILHCMEKADPKIKSVILDEPILYTKFLTANGDEFELASRSSDATRPADSIYNRLALRNILAGRVELFNYDSAFKVELGEALYPDVEYAPIYPNRNSITTSGEDGTQIGFLQTECVKDLTQQAQGHGENYLTLNPNEVIRFRAPSLKTITPYSAYINYFLILNNKVNTQGEAARFLSISELWDLPMDPENSREIGSTNSFGYSFFKYITHQTVNALPEPAYIGNESPTDFGTYINLSSIDVDKITKTNLEETWTKLVYAAKTSCLYKYDNTRTKWLPVPGTPSISSGNLEVLINGANSEAENEFDKGQYFIVDLQNTALVFNNLMAWASLFGLFNRLAGKEPTSTEANLLAYFQEETLTKYNLIDTGDNGDILIFRNIGTNAERLPGKYINSSLEKFMPCTKPDISAQLAWDAYYWPAPRMVNAASVTLELITPTITTIGTTNAWKNVNLDSTLAGPPVGTDQVINTISPNEEYELREGEHLFINYTPSNTTTDGSSSTSTLPINLHYGKGTKIKPNDVLTLEDSATRHGTNKYSWAKTSGFDFSAYQRGGEVEGMYSIGPNEQLDIRDFIEVDLSETVNLYWILEDTIKLTGNPVRPDEVSSYTLKDGEYVFYTDKHKLDMAYYGSGTEIRTSPTSTKVFTLAHDITQVNLEEILVKGVSAVPWHAVALTQNDSLTFREFQYVTLTAGDFVRGLVLKDDEDQLLSNTWHAVDPDTPCYYAFAGTSPINDGIVLPKFNFIDESIGWEVRSILELDVGPDKAQILNEGNSITLLSTNQQPIILGTAEDGSDITAITPKANGAPLAIKTNYPWQSSEELVKVVTAKDSSQDSAEQLYFRLKVFENAPVSAVTAYIPEDEATENEINTLIDGCASEITLYNFNNVWTSIGNESFTNTTANLGTANTDTYNYIKAYTTTPDDHYNLFLVYYLKSDSQLAYNQNMGFQFYKYDKDNPDNKYNLDSTGECIKIFNNISINKLDEFIDAQGSYGHTGVIDFDTYFDELSWWDYSEIGYSAQEGRAFGNKEVASIADIKQAAGSTEEHVAAAYRQIPGVYFLKPGINILVFKDSGEFRFFSEVDTSGALRISDIDSIDATTPDLGMNLELLDYRLYDDNSRSPERVTNMKALQLLRDIKERDTANEFYYNCPIQTATAIDINKNLLTAVGNEERLSDPKFWYDKNNLNNKFVISELDADFLKTGITIAKASKIK